MSKALKNKLDQSKCLFPEDISQTIHVVVSFDGTWHYHGIKSSHGVGDIMSIDTCEVLDTEILSQDCSKTQMQMMNELSRKHAKSSLSEKKCFGPSTSKETDGKYKILGL